MATPEIGTSISEGYSRGMDRIGAWMPTLIVYAALSAIIAAIAAQVQTSLIPDTDDIVRSILEGGEVDSDLRMYTIVGAIGTAVNMVIGFGIYVVLGGALHRERHSGDGSVPSPGAAIPALLGGVGSLMPKAAILIGLMVFAQILPVLLGVLGTLIGIALWVAYIMFAIRWIYAPIVAGGGEGTGDEAFARSEAVVSGSWWGTLGTFIVIGIATLVPFAIGGAIVGAILPGALLSAAGSAFVIALVGFPVFSAALESAWAQVEGDGGGGDDHRATPPPATEQRPPADEPPAGPFV